MTSPSPFSRRPVSSPELPKGEALGTYESYLEAQAAVEKLSRADFDVTKVSIVGNDLKTVERVTGKITYGRAAAAGAASGAWFGLFAGLLFFIFTTTPNVGYVLAAILIGAGSGMLFGVGTFAINRRRRDFTSTHQVIASNYQVVVPADQIVRAQEALSRAAELD